MCSHCGWLLLKCSAIGIGFNGAENNCEIAHILGILLMNGYEGQICSEATFICSSSPLNCYIQPWFCTLVNGHFLREVPDTDLCGWCKQFLEELS